MKRFAKLIQRLDDTNSTNDKVELLAEYFADATREDTMWALFLLAGRTTPRPVKTPLLREWIVEETGLPPWLIAESYHMVGDLAETIALLHPNQESAQDSTLTQWIEYLESLSKDAEEDKRAKVIAAWRMLSTAERFIFNKIITGGFRLGVSRALTVKALARAMNLDEATLAHRLMGDWSPRELGWSALSSGEMSESKPYPFFLAYQLDVPPESLGDACDWQFEWKWDGIRGQIVRRKGQVFIWSRGEELVTDRFPELAEASESLPDGTVIDGEIIGWAGGRPLSFKSLQTRIGRKKLSAKVLHETPIVFIAHDMLEENGEDLRNAHLSRRRARLESLMSQNLPQQFILSPVVAPCDWSMLQEVKDRAREHRAEGLMLKRLSSAYGVGRRRGDWWKLKIDPLSVDAVLIYAQEGSGKRAELFTDYTFGVWQGDVLVPFAKAYSGLTDKEISRVDDFIRKHTNERFGPVRTVKPELVFEIGFDSIQRSTRHKSGFAVRFPRILRWRQDKPAAEAGRVEELESLLEG